MASTSDVLKQFVAKHGNPVGQPYATDPTITVEQPATLPNGLPDPAGGTVKVQQPNPDPIYHYTFADGSTLDVTGQSGQVKAQNEVKPGSQTPKGGPLSDYQQVLDPTTKLPIALYNPNTGDKIDLPAVKPGQQAQIVNGGNGVIYSWDGQNLTQLTQATPDKPQLVQTAGGGLYSWDGQGLKQLQAPQAPARHVAVVGNNLVDTDTGKVVYTGTEGVKFQTAQDGTILAIDPNNPSNVQTIWSPPKPPQMVPGQSVNQPSFLQTDPTTGAITAVPNPIYGQGSPTTVSGQAGPTILQQMPDGSYRSVPNPAYVSKQQQALSDLQAGINQIQQQIASGQIDVGTADKYKTLLQQNYQSALLGTTPYQQVQDLETRKQQLAALGQSLLNDRVTQATGLGNSLLSSAVGIVGNKNFMDPSAIAGFTPFSSAAQYVTDLGGGSDVYNAAKSALMKGFGPDPASALLASALGGTGSNGPALPSTPSVTPQPPTAPSAPVATSPADALQASQRNMLAGANPSDNNLQSLLLSAAFNGLGAMP